MLKDVVASGEMGAGTAGLHSFERMKEKLRVDANR